MDTSGVYIKGTGDFEIKELSAQDGVLKELDKGKQYWECTGAGTFTERQPYAYGSGGVWLYKGGVGNKIGISFINSDLDSSGSYEVEFRNTSNYLAFKKDGARLFWTANDYVNDNIWYEIEWDRTLDGTFTIKIRGGAFGNIWTLIDVSGGSGTNPILDNTYTESIYQVLDLDVGDRYISGVQRQGVKQ